MSVCVDLPEAPRVPPTRRHAGVVASTSTPRDGAGTAPTTEQLFSYAVEQIMAAAHESWPGDAVQLGEYVPSVTGYVQRIEVAGQALFAKYSFLGSSLVSVLRGRCGDWDRVRAAQRAYVAAPGSLLEREAAQLGLLQRLGRPRAQRVAALRRGVLFTEIVPGASLAQLLADEPQRANELLRRTWAELPGLHRQKGAQRFARSAAIQERSIAGTFVRKFGSIDVNICPDRLAAARRDHPNEPDDLAELRLQVVARLGRLWASTTTSAPVLVYGDLKPEHVVFEQHALAMKRPIFIDPGLQRAQATVDAAKLVSRTILLMTGMRLAVSEAIGDGLAAFVADQIQALPAGARREWVRELVLLWLMDTVNILTTYLSTPAELPLPAQAKIALSQVRELWALVDKVSGELADGTDPHSVWRHGLVDAVGYARLKATA